METAEPLYPLVSLARLRMDIDGEGVTTLIAGANCPLSCKWCINKAVLRNPSKAVTPQELFDRVKIDDLYFQATGGGVTFGGGESLLHINFIQSFRKVCGNAWKIYAETALHVPTEAIDVAAEIIDGFIVDIKDMNPGIYKAYTGKDATLPHENLQKLLSLAGPERILVRIPLIPDFNTPEDQNRSLETLKAMGFTRFDPFSYVIREEMLSN
ncbi:MAG: radical SAM protein [Oscillospiraceae bacterium]|nr:radical SAM protein [Oscillospiraceae bacterium]